LIGVGLTTDAVPLWMHLSLMDECRSRVEQALVALDAASARDAPREPPPPAALATPPTHTHGTLPEMEAAWEKTLALAELLDESLYLPRALSVLWDLKRVSRWRDAALKEATRFCNEAVNQADPNHRLIGERILGVAHHYLGDQARARGHLETVLAQYVESENRSHIVRFQVDRRASARTFLARVLWLQGFPSQATQAADAAIEDARAADHAMSLCHALVFAACPLALMTGDLASGERYASMLKELSTGHGLTRWDAYARVYQGALLIKQGEVATGWRLVNAEFDQAGFGRLPFMDFQVAIVAEFWHASEIAARLGAVEKAITEAEESGELRLIAELLRIKGEMLLIQGGPNAAATAERLFRQALDWARRQGALSWELRAATNLARLMRDHDRPADAMALLQPVYDRFTEGFDTVDLKTAKALLDALR
jgi:predicted ATPase